MQSNKNESTSPKEIESPNAVPRSLLTSSLSIQVMAKASVHSGRGFLSDAF
jgi:hypothetical protein